MLGLSKRRIQTFPLVVLLSTLLVVGRPGTEPAAAGPLGSRLLVRINRIRMHHGLRAVRLSERLSDDAKEHTRAMIRRDRLYHTQDLSRVLRPYRWRFSGEVVGCARTLHRLVRSWMRSSAHRSILLTRGFRRVGVGVIASRVGDRCGSGVSVWATAILYG